MGGDSRLPCEHIGSYSNDRPTILRCGVTEVARLDERVGGIWFAFFAGTCHTSGKSTLRWAPVSMFGWACS